MSEDMAALVDSVVRRTIELSEVPAPTGGEGDRAELVRSWWEADGHGDVRLDTVGNVWARARAGDGPALLSVRAPGYGLRCRTFRTRCEHTTARCTVRASATTRSAWRRCPRLRPCSGQGSMPVWLLSTVGEEGLGNLRGAISALEAPAAEVGAFVAVEGNYLGRVSMTGVGSSSPPGHRPWAGRARVGGRRVAERDPSSGRAGRPRSSRSLVRRGPR